MDLTNKRPDMCTSTDDGVVDGALSECQYACWRHSTCTGIPWINGNCDKLRDQTCDYNRYVASGTWRIQSRGFSNFKDCSANAPDLIKGNDACCTPSTPCSKGQSDCDKDLDCSARSLVVRIIVGGATVTIVARVRLDEKLHDQ